MFTYLTTKISIYISLNRKKSINGKLENFLGKEKSCINNMCLDRAIYIILESSSFLFCVNQKEKK